MTPWGQAGALRERRLYPGLGTPREDVQRNQRERLLGAIVATATARGYGATSVAHLVELSGVSRKAFYELFDGKQDCFLAALDYILDGAVAVAASRFHFEGSWEERAERSMTAFFKLIVAQPAASRFCLVEALAAGPEAVERVDRSLCAFKELMGGALEERPEYRGMPEEMLWALIEGCRKLIHSRLHRGTEQELPDLGPGLVKLGLATRPPPIPLRPKRRRKTPGGASGNGAGQVRVPGGESDPGERIVRATLAIVAEKGYAAATIVDIAEAARVSLTTFYEQFDGKRQAFEAAVYAGRARMVAYALPAYRRARTWPAGFRAGTEFTLDFLASEPEFARLISRDIYAAGPAALERLDRGIEAAQRTIEDGVEGYAPEMEPIWREAIMSTLYAMLCRRVRAEGPEALPEMAPLATYMALAPFIGPEAACEVANGAQPPPAPGGRSGRGA